MAANPLVSVVIPTYNRAHLVGRAIESVLAQTYAHTEIIIVDDGSTDDTQQTLRSYGRCIRVVIQENSGPSIARNRGIALAQGEIIAFLDSDDIWLPTKLERQVDAMAKADASVPCCLCNCQVVYKDGSRTSTFNIADTLPGCATGLWLNPAEVLLTRFVLFNQAVAIRRSVLERVGSFDENLRFGEDYELPLRLALEGPWIIIGDELVVYHAASTGSWADKALRQEVRLREDLLQIRSKILDLIERNPRHAGFRKLARRELLGAKRDLAVAQLVGHKFSGAVALARSLRLMERLRRGIFRRTPLYPRMRVQPMS
jgi:glycosyltransferase involved in cell wall biosynthesis